MMITTYEQGVAKGIEKGMEKGIELGRQQGLQKGLQEGRREAVRLLLVKKFGPLSAAVAIRLVSWPAERLNELLLAVSDAPSLHALGLAEDDK